MPGKRSERGVMTYPILTLRMSFGNSGRKEAVPAETGQGIPDYVTFIEVDEGAFELFVRMIAGEASHIIGRNRQGEQAPGPRGRLIPGIFYGAGFLRAQGD